MNKQQEIAANSDDTLTLKGAFITLWLYEDNQFLDDVTYGNDLVNCIEIELAASCKKYDVWALVDEGFGDQQKGEPWRWIRLVSIRPGREQRSWVVNGGNNPTSNDTEPERIPDTVWTAAEEEWWGWNRSW
jgi:hypothetical protein